MNIAEEPAARPPSASSQTLRFRLTGAPTMSFTAVRRTLIFLHRWIALILTPVFLVIILTGAVLSFRPILSGAQGPQAGSAVDVAALGEIVGRIEAAGQIGAISVVDGGRALQVMSQDPAVGGRWDLASGAHSPARPGGFDLFRTAQDLHKTLLLGLGIVVEVASFLMLGIMVAGPFLAWLRFRNTVMGWHTAVGWLLLPLTLTSPVTAVMLSLHIGTGSRPELPRTKRPVTIGEALTIAAREIDVGRLAGARRFRGGTVMLQIAPDSTGRNGGGFVVTDSGVTPLVGGPSLVKQIHEGTWGGAWSGALNFAISLALLGLTVTGLYSWSRRKVRNRARPVSAGGDILVAHASQTGTAARLAGAVFDGLVAGGEKPTLAALGALKPAEIAQFPLVLVIASTTGDGELPDNARAVVKALRGGVLAGVRFAILGLGDRSYAHFCGGAHRLRAAFLAAGAREALPLREVDRDPAAPFLAWADSVRADLALRLNVEGLSPAPSPVTLTVAARQRLDAPGAGDTRETWRIWLDGAGDLAFRPGDLVRIAAGAGERPRSYSVGSSSRVDPRRIALTVRLHEWTEDDGHQRLGRVSGFLSRHAAEGMTVTAQLDPHPGFNPPGDPQWPVLMIAAGSGIAPFPGFIAERRASGRAGPAWLIFGNRHRDGDFLWRDVFEAALADGSLTRMDTAFSRDSDDGARVQDRLRQNAAEVFEWLVERKAIVYICGRRAMADAVLEVLAEVLVTEGGLKRETAQAEIGQWVADGRVRVDTFN